MQCRMSHLVHKAALKFQQLYPCFEVGQQKRQEGILSDVSVCRKSKMVALTGSRNDITYISAPIHDSNEIPTAIPMGLSWQSYVQAGIYDIAYVLPLFNGGHVWFTSHPDVRDYSHQSHCVAGPRKWGGGSRWNSVAGNCSRSAIRATGNSGITSAFLISGFIRLDFRMVWHRQRKRCLQRSRKLAKQHCVRSHRWNALFASRVTKYITFRLKKIHLPNSVSDIAIR